MINTLQGDCRNILPTLPEKSFNCCVTSPPYYALRDYGVAGQIGLEQSPQQYVDQIVSVFMEVHRVLRDDGTLWLNLGDSYANDENFGGYTGGKHASGLHGNTKVGRLKRTTGLKSKDLIGIPWRVAFALQEKGWYLRSDIIWHKPNPMPESVQDRPTRSHEYIFLLSKSQQYYYDSDAIKERATCFENRPPGIVRDRLFDCDSKEKVLRPNKKRGIDKQRGHSRRHAGFNDRWDAMEKSEQCSGYRNKRDVWTVATKPFPEAHFATFPPELIAPCILAGCPEGGNVIDPFAGSGTTGEVCERLGRNATLIELNPQYIEMITRRTSQGGVFSARSDVICMVKPAKTFDRLVLDGTGATPELKTVTVELE